MNRPPLPSPGRHFQLVAVANSVAIEKAHYGVAGGRQQMLLINFAHRPLKEVFLFLFSRALADGPDKKLGMQLRK